MANPKKSRMVEAENIVTISKVKSAEKVDLSFHEALWREKMLQPIEIPSTTPLRYISYNQALNLREPGEDTGDWHFKVMFFCMDGGPRDTANLAGEGTDVDSTPSLGSYGVRDMADELARKKVLPKCGPVHVANHYRAITDLALEEFLHRRVPMTVSVRTINQWLDTEAQMEILVRDYLVSLGDQLIGEAREIYESWLPTVQYD